MVSSVTSFTLLLAHLKDVFRLASSTCFTQIFVKAEEQNRHIIKSADDSIRLSLLEGEEVG